MSEREIDRVRECERMREIEEKLRDSQRKRMLRIDMGGGRKKKHERKLRDVNMERERGDG